MEILIGKTVRLVYSWLDSKGIHKRKLKSAYCYFHYEMLVNLSGRYIRGAFELLGFSDKKCAVCALEE